MNLPSQQDCGRFPSPLSKGYQGRVRGSVLGLWSQCACESRWRLSVNLKLGGRCHTARRLGMFRRVRPSLAKKRKVTIFCLSYGVNCHTIQFSDECSTHWSLRPPWLWCRSASHTPRSCESCTDETSSRPRLA